MPADRVRRRSTFLKRKGGLFKKAYELSVLCSVDVAVIIFGHNKKLYEFSSGDINETIGRYHYVCPRLSWSFFFFFLLSSPRSPSSLRRTQTATGWSTEIPPG